MMVSSSFLPIDFVVPLLTRERERERYLLGRRRLVYRKTELCWFFSHNRSSSEVLPMNGLMMVSLWGYKKEGRILHDCRNVEVCEDKSHAPSLGDVGEKNGC